MADFLYGVDRNTVLSIAGTFGLLVFGTVFFFRSNQTATVPKKKTIAGKKPVKSVTETVSRSSNAASTSTSATSGTSSSSSSSPSRAPTSTVSGMKGYKMTSDGRKTTYFNREITEEEKVLLGDSTPKPLNSTLSADSLGVLSASAKSGSSTGSAWNTAGTWEEKNCSPWAAKRIRELLTSASLDILVNKAVAGSVTITKISSIEGDALVTMIRGKKRYIYDYTLSLDWKLQIGITVITGTVGVSDVNAECDYEFTISTSTPLTSPALRDGVQKYVKGKGEGVQALIRQKLDRFLFEFKELDQ